MLTEEEIDKFAEIDGVESVSFRDEIPDYGQPGHLTLHIDEQCTYEEHEDITIRAAEVLRKYTNTEIVASLVHPLRRVTECVECEAPELVEVDEDELHCDECGATVPRTDLPEDGEAVSLRADESQYNGLLQWNPSTHGGITTRGERLTTDLPEA